MGNKNRKRQNNIDLGDTADDYYYESEFTRQSSDNRERDKSRNKDKTFAVFNNRHDNETSKGRKSLDAQTNLEFDPYFTIVEDLKKKLEASRTATEDAFIFYIKY